MQAISIEECRESFEQNGSILALLKDEEKHLLRSTISCITYERGEVIFSKGDLVWAFTADVKREGKDFQGGHRRQRANCSLSASCGFRRLPFIPCRRTPYHKCHRTGANHYLHNFTRYICQNHPVESCPDAGLV